VPFIIRWPGTVPAGSVSNEIVHEMDLFPTFATLAGGNVPADRILDGVDQTRFFRGEQDNSNREAVVIYVGNDIYGVKWRNWKMVPKEIDSGFGEPLKIYPTPAFYNLHLDPREEHPVLLAPENLWVRYPASQVLADHAESLTREVPIKPGTPDPYRPPGR
jgi:arylsulfatase